MPKDFYQERLIDLVCLALVTIPLTLFFLRNAPGPLRDEDEAAWVFKTYHYHLAFQLHEFRHRDWQDPESYDHPPLARWIFGAALSGKGLVATSLENQHWWRERGYDLFYHPEFREELTVRATEEALRILRRVAFIFGLLTLVAVYCLAYSLGRPTALLASFFVGIHPLFQDANIKAMTDTQTLFWITAALAIQVNLVRHLARPDFSTTKTIPWLFLLAIALALGFLTKINVVMAAILWGILCAIHAIRHPSMATRLRFVLSGIGTILIAWTLAVALNPTFWPHPIDNPLRMFSTRLSEVVLQRQYFAPEAFENWGTQAAYFVRHLFFDQSWCFQQIRVPLELIAVIIGILLWARKLGDRVQSSEDESGTLISFLSILFVICGITSVTFAMNWPRYLLPSLPILGVVAAGGIVECLKPLGDDTQTETIANLHRKLIRQWIIVAAAVSICLLLARGPLAPPVNSLTETEKKIQSFELALRLHPHNKTIRATLAVLYEDAGESKRAESAWKDVFATDPLEEFPLVTADRLRFFEIAAERYPQSPFITKWLEHTRSRAEFMAYRDGFYLNGHRRTLLGISYDNALQATGDVVRAKLDEIKELGCNLITIRGAVFNQDGTVKSAELERLLLCHTEAGKRGIIIGTSIQCAWFSEPGFHREALVSLAAALRPMRNGYIDLAPSRNLRDAHFVPISELRQLRDVVKKIDPNRPLTATHQGEMKSDDLRDYVDVAQLDFIAVQGPPVPYVLSKRAGTQLNQWVQTATRRVPVIFERTYIKPSEDAPVAPDFYQDLQGALEARASGWILRRESRDDSTRPIADQLNAAERTLFQKIRNP